MVDDVVGVDVLSDDLVSEIFVLGMFGYLVFVGCGFYVCLFEFIGLCVKKLLIVYVLIFVVWVEVLWE